jgi:RNA polymerase sigma-70 factor (ECF subfamily)
MTSTWPSSVLFHAAVAVREQPDLVTRLQRGDCDAYRELISQYGQALYNTALRITGSASDAEDVLQETFVSAYQHVRSFEERSSLRTWLTRVCINAALTRLRRNGRRRAWSLDEMSEGGVDEAPHELPDRGESPEQAVRVLDLRRLLDRYLAKLSPALRQVFVLRDLEELSGEETAQALGITVAAVKTRLSRARMALRTYLEPHLFRHAAQGRV